MWAAPYLGLMKESSREAAYRTLTEPLSMVEVAREMGVTGSFVGKQIRGGQLRALPNGRVTGAELAMYLALCRRDARENRLVR